MAHSVGCFDTTGNRKPQRLSSATLKHGWAFKQSDQVDDADSTPWLPVKAVPSTVHRDLIDNHKLADPFVDLNEEKAEWVGQKSWTYRTKFNLPGNRDLTQLRQEHIWTTKIVLAFDGLDTFATVKVEGQTVLQADNMFLPYRVDVTAIILAALRKANSVDRTKTEYDLEIRFEPALLKARHIQARYPDHKWICSNGESARLAVRKAQYHWGWDWGPFLMCCGIWREVRVEVYEAKILDIRADIEVSEDLEYARIDIDIDTDGFFDPEPDLQENGGSVTVVVSRNGDEEAIVTRVIKVTESGKIRTQMNVKLTSLDLWWPAGYGNQTMFNIDVALFSKDDVQLHSKTLRYGIRRLELVQKHDSHGKSFYFRVNDVDIFCGGSCWIPADSFLPNVTPDRYRSWLELMISANQKMVRVWGGGVYEDDAFYDTCDELGILVWQDFMFACGNYPAFPSFLASINEEATSNLKRIRHHPSLALLAGNNEDYQIRESSGLTYDYADKDVEHWLKTDFPARYIYEHLLPTVIALQCPSVPYHPGSPWGDGKITSDPTVGDLHQWNVWHGTQEKYQIFDTLGGRFNSEFGMEAFPHIDTIKSFIKDKKNLYPQSQVMDYHNKAAGHERRVAAYMVENVRLNPTLEAYIHLTQLVQSEALMFAYRGWRKQWGDNRKCGGALVWQLNDCWPVTSWSICDYYLRRKPAYYAVARTLAPVAIGVRREHFDWSVSHARQPKKQPWESWAVNSQPVEVRANVELRFISVKTGEEIQETLFLKDVQIAANGTTHLSQGIIDNSAQEPHVIAARLWVGGELVARDTDWPQPLKYLPFPDRKVRVECDKDQVVVTAERPVKCLVFEERIGCELSDSGIDVIPGDLQIIRVEGLKPDDSPLRWTYLGADEQ